ncbi:family 20 glycosylhydrolase [Saccharicrinis sp. GN24d3]|uniref:family 20 glycosylhydrolase n=1 Tax=Saccharicrinis sp. GN24d3 TaxID=3458416 RepID=UPI004035B4F2
MKIFKNVILGLLTLFAFVACTEKKQRSQELAIVPQPNEIVKQDGFFSLTSNTTFVVPDNDNLKAAAELINSRFKNAAGFKLDVTLDKPSKNFIAIELNTNSGLGKEEYTLDVTSKGATVNASTERGAFYGLMTILQLLPPEIESTSVVNGMDWYMPCVKITDGPRFVWRGMHLDVCRHFVPVEFIKKQLDVMALFKMNTFHWHLTEDQGWRIEIKKYPKLTVEGAIRTEGEGNKYGGFYTQEEVKEIVAYAKKRFINVVPEIELPGHSLGAITAYPDLSCTGGPFKIRNIWGVEPDVYCAGKEEVFSFLEDVINEVIPLFPYEYFHIGGDESPKDRWKKCPDCQGRIKKEGLADEHELQSYFIKRIEKLLLAHDKKMIGWDEILEGGLAESAAVMSWRGEKGGIEAAEQGHDVVMTPGNWVYLDHYQGSNKVEPVAIGGYTTLEESYGYDPVPKDLEAEKAKHILGTQGNVWSEYMYTPELFEYRIYPRIIALAEVGWTHKENKNFDDFVKRMDNQFVRLDLHNINYHIPLPEGPIDLVAFTDKATLAFTATRPIKMVYTIDGSEPNRDSNVYSTPLSFTENTTVKIRSVLKSGKMSTVRTIKVEKQTYRTAEDVKTIKKGLKMREAEGTFINVSDLNKAKDWKESVLNKKKFGGMFDMKKPSAAILTGFIDIDEDAVYEFSTNVDQFFIGDELLINNDGEVKRFSRNNTSIALAKGKHPVKIVFLNNIVGGWPQAWNGPSVSFKKAGDKKFTTLSTDKYSF